MTASQFTQIYQHNAAAVAQELLQGLCAPQAFTSPKYLYDALGSRLFEAITEVPEYDLTRTEAQVMHLHGRDMARCVPAGACWIDLGAGNCEKAGRLLGPMQAARYVAVDISVDYLRGALDSLQRQHPQVPMAGVGTDFSSGLDLPPELDFSPTQPRVLFYPGSSIGNFTPDHAVSFLGSLHSACGTAPVSGLLIGVDLLKDVAELEAAYDDALGVTAAFDLNLLLHINRLVGSDFAVRDWRHLSRFNAQASRVEMHLQARHDVRVCWPGGERLFAQGNTIHTENACKWTVPSFDALLRSAGFASTRCWTDPASRFAVFWAWA
ncbi:MAG: L-histidine N(alpha)-methyltransferase [Ramlibacter sp.]|uniref:L-histidine N(alpha)-methyltransferase n=1 Tax=Ramlibacter sp. TaxID=1917967 RepID=UPI00260E3650|nr:L-histidine N(alpha)-methyltransferase [Ramlibacter sp.]MDH4376604.1 L-histidine N(alpha)-methyltransferase [Ramlibacter sp.]